MGNYYNLCEDLISLVERCPVTSDMEWISERNHLIVTFHNLSRVTRESPKPLRKVAEEVSICANSWEPKALLIGNVSAAELASLASYVVDRFPEG